MKAHLFTCALLGPLLLGAPLTLTRADTPAYESRNDSDPSLSEAVRSRITAQVEPGVQDLKVLTDRDGTVHLSGHVSSPAQAERAAQIARSTHGVRHVRNDLVISADPHG
jgi:osmotically-inducible protein OsmY